MDFLFNYSEDHAILLPGRVPGYKDTKVKLLPSSTTKKQVWSTYCEADNFRNVSYKTFLKIWKRYNPRLIVMKPMTDLCAVCQENSKLILHVSNKPESEKSIVSIVIAYMQHELIHVHVGIWSCGEAPFCCQPRERIFQASLHLCASYMINL